MVYLVLKWILTTCGHLAISCVMFNHVHAQAVPKRPQLGFGTVTAKRTEKLVIAFALLPLFIVFFWQIFLRTLSFDSYLWAIQFYFGVAQVVFLGFLVRWFYRSITAKLPVGVTLIRNVTIDLQQQHSESLLSGTKARLLGQLPGNQITRLNIQHWHWQLPQLPPELDGLKICQLSDLHFTGLIDRAYFESVVEHANQTEPDLIFITGDIIDNETCLDWIDEVLSQLTAKWGVYFVLGNHDCLIHAQKDLHRRLAAAGLIHVADGKWHPLSVAGADIQLAGNELPWYGQADDLPRLPQSERGFTILLSHSPDQIGWAINHNFDLVFAGHTHGGQIRLPIVGPIISPSRYGIKYASGTFRTRGTLMHVSRGISGDEPIRINCLPELGLFTLGKSEQ